MVSPSIGGGLVVTTGEEAWVRWISPGVELVRRGGEGIGADLRASQMAMMAARMSAGMTNRSRVTEGRSPAEAWENWGSKNSKHSAARSPCCKRTDQTSGGVRQRKGPPACSAT